MDFVQKSNPTAISWVTKTKSYNRGESDVEITIGKSNGKERMAMTLRNNAHKKFGTDFLVFGIDGNKLWFAEATSQYGYKMSTSGKDTRNTNRYVSCSDETLVAWTHNHIGSYRLDKDVKSGLYFIDAREVS